MKLSHKGLALVGFLLVLQLAFIGGLSLLLDQSEAETLRLSRSKDRISRTNQILELVNAVYLVFEHRGIADYGQGIAQFKSAVTKIRGEVSELRTLVADQPKRQELLDRTAAMIKDADVLMAFLEESNRRGTLIQDIPRINEKIPQLEKLQIAAMQGLFEFLGEDKKVEIEAERAASQSRMRALSMLWAGIAINIVIAVALAWSFLKGITGRLEIIAANTQRLAERSQLHPSVGGSDEIAFLDKVFHDMAGVLAEADRKKQEVEAARCEFANMASRELSKPLTAIQKTLTDLLNGACGAPPEQALPRLRRAEKNTARLIGLVNSLLSIDQLELGKIELELSQVSIAELIESSVAALEGLSEAKQIKVTCNLTDCQFMADREKILQVTTNLIGNAVKFSPESSSVVIESSVSPAGEICVSIQDRGCGIPKEFQKTIFEKFKQVDNQSADVRKSGTGLGLAIARGIVLAHGGSIGVESQEKEGSRFWIKLPKSPPPVSTAAGDEVPLEAEPVVIERPLWKTGLVVLALFLLLELSLFGTLAFLFNQAESSVQRLAASKNRIARSQHAIELLVDAHIAASALPDKAIEYYESALKGMQDEVEELSRASEGVADRKEILEKLKTYSGRAFEDLSLAVKERDLYHPKMMKRYIHRVKFSGIAAIGDLFAYARRDKKIEAAAQREQLRQRRQLKNFLGLLLVLDIVAGVLVMVMFTRGIARRLDIVTDNTRRLAAKEPLTQPLGGGDEISCLDQSLHVAAQRLAEADRKSEEMDELRRTFIAMVSHDLRSPLTSIELTISMLLTGALGELPENATLRLMTAQETTSKLINLVNGILSIEQIESGKLTLEQDYFPLSELMARSLEAVGRLAAEKNIKIESRISDLAISGDLERLNLVVTNLLANAIKFSASGGTVKVRSQSSPGWVVVDVEDSGSGIPEQYQAKIFERFQQIPGPAQAKTAGAGMGLALAKAVVLWHGGQIGVQSAPAQGSTFWFKLPVESDSEE